MPTDTKEAKTFLGYEWSRAKGNEGIKYLGGGDSSSTDEDAISRNQGIKSIKTPLFDNSRLNDEDAPKLNSLIRKNFRGILSDIPEELKPFAHRVLLTDMLDFDAATFDKQIKTNVTEKLEVKSCFPLEKIKDVCVKINPPKDEISLTANDLVSFVPMEAVSDEGFIVDKINKKFSIVRNRGYTYFAEGDIIIAKITPCMENGKCALATGLTNGVAFGSSEFHVFRADTNRLMSAFLFIYLNRPSIRQFAQASMTGSSGHRRVPISFYEKLDIPLPPLSVQEAVVYDCKAVDADYAKAKKTIEDSRAKIAALFNEAQTKTIGSYKLSDADKFSLQIGRRVLNTEVSPDYDIPVFSANVFVPFGNIDKLLKTLTDFSVDSVLWGIDGDWMVNCIEKDNPFYPTDHCGVLRVNESFAVAKFVAFALHEAGKSAGFDRAHRASIDRVAALSISLPSLAEQKKIVAAVEAEEAKIAEAKAIMSACPARKRGILRKHGVLL